MSKVDYEEDLVSNNSDDVDDETMSDPDDNDDEISNAEEIFKADAAAGEDIADDDEADEPDYGDEDYFQKIDQTIRDDFVASYHPQLRMPSNEQLKLLTQVRRNEKGAIDDPLHRTPSFVTKYEKAHIIGARCAQLENGAEPLIPLFDEAMTDRMIATEEFNQKVLPFIIWRPFPNGGGEFWNLADLEII
jgi:DNA-directed RNA polymerase I, II, and III subunit RPABC2